MSITWSSTDKGPSITVSSNVNGPNLRVTSSGIGSVRSTEAKTSGKWYWEVLPTAVGSGLTIGVASDLADMGIYAGADVHGWGYYSGGGILRASSVSGTQASYGANLIGIALDMDNKTIQFFKDGVATGALITGLESTMYAAIGSSGGGIDVSTNFGATAFVYAPPSGFLALSTAPTVQLYKPVVHLGGGTVGDRTSSMVLELQTVDIETALGYLPLGQYDVPSTVFPADDDFNYGTGVDTLGARRTGSTPWITGYQSTDTRVITQGHLIWTIPQETTSDGSMRTMWQPVPTGDWQYRCKISFWNPPGTVGSFSNYSFAGIAVRNSSTGKLIDLHRIMEGNTDRHIQVNRWDNNGTTYLTSAITNGAYLAKYDIPFTGLIYLDIEQVGTNLLFSMSGSGLPGSFIPLTTEPIANHLASVDQIGLDMLRSVSPYSTTAGYDWFRRIK